MSYLIVQMLWCLIIAFLLGLLLGWLLCKIMKGCGGSKTCSKEPCDLPAASVTPAIVPNTDITDLDTNVDLDGDDYAIETLEGIGPQTGDLFRGYGVASVGDYLRKLHSPVRRDQAAQDLNIRVKPLHDWASMSDLLRVEGVDHQFAELTYAAGVKTVADLAAYEPEDLVRQMDEVNNAGKQLIAPSVPDVSDVSDWVGRARGMNPVISV